MIKTTQISYTHGDTLTPTEVEVLKAFRLLRCMFTDPLHDHDSHDPDCWGAVALLDLISHALDGLNVSHAQYLLNNCEQMVTLNTPFSKNSEAHKEDVKALHSLYIDQE